MVRQPVHAHLASLTGPSRDRHCSILPVHDRVAQLFQSNEEGHQVGAHRPYCINVLIFNNTCGNQPKRLIRLLHR